MSVSTERDRQWHDLRLPAGVAGSGRRRYAAAMWYFWEGELPEVTLEVYRALALDDHADPEAELRRIGLARSGPAALTRGRACATLPSCPPKGKPR